MIVNKKCGRNEPHTGGSVHDYHRHGCRCEPCKKANAKYQREMRQRMMKGTNETISNNETRAIILAQLDKGVTYREMAEKTGMSIGGLHRIASRGGKMTYRRTAQRIAETLSERPEMT